MEINVIRGISYSVPNPKDVDTYVKIEFPYPQVSCVVSQEKKHIFFFQFFFILGNTIPSKISVNPRHRQPCVQ